MVIKNTDFGVNETLGLNLSLAIYQLCDRAMLPLEVLMKIRRNNVQLSTNYSA